MKIEKALQETRELLHQLNQVRTREANLLAAAEEILQRSEHRLATVREVVDADNNSQVEAAVEKRHRAELLADLQALFPVKETVRGLVITIPSKRSARQLAQLGKILSAVPSPKLVEIESRVFGENPRKNQVAAFRQAHRLKDDILQGSGLDPASVVARGRPTLPEKNSKEMTGLDEIIVSGDFLGNAMSVPE